MVKIIVKIVTSIIKIKNLYLKNKYSILILMELGDIILLSVLGLILTSVSTYLCFNLENINEEDEY